MAFDEEVIKQDDKVEEIEQNIRRIAEEIRAKKEKELAKEEKQEQQEEKKEEETEKRSKLERKVKAQDNWGESWEKILADAPDDVPEEYAEDKGQAGETTNEYDVRVVGDEEPDRYAKKYE